MSFDMMHLGRMRDQTTQHRENATHTTAEAHNHAALHVAFLGSAECSSGRPCCCSPMFQETTREQRKDKLSKDSEAAGSSRSRRKTSAAGYRGWKVEHSIARRSTVAKGTMGQSVVV